MIKLVVFDLDGVLIDAKEIHYESLNRALVEVSNEYIISREEHMNEYDGLPTRTKLDKLSTNKGLPTDVHDSVWLRKQELTASVIKDKVPFDDRLRSVLQQLKNSGYMVYVCSNSIRESLKLMLYKSGLIEFVDYYMGNEDCTHTKPSPELYLRAMVHAGVKPSETIIVEDSYHGREAATSSGGHLCGVDTPIDVTHYRLMKQINSINEISSDKTKWDSDDFNVLIPMAGAGSRFANAGYTFPKPLIEVNHKPMIQVVVENLNIKANFIYLVQKSHYEKYNLKYLLNLITPNCQIIQVGGITEGAACTTLLAKKHVDNDKHLLIANSDQFIE
jgi:HAD superfamily hydrolase (TIGR01509 family)